MAENPSIGKHALTPETVAQCIEVYSDLIQTIYHTTRPKLDQAQILENDEWRYSLSAQIKPGQGLSKDQLAKLVQWKITHGTHRPFLPGMINKNSPEEVKTCTVAAAKTLAPFDSTNSRADITAAVTAALTEVCKLKGVGPATGTLVLSIFKPDIVPFFQDETYYWITSEHDKKLKYDKKEYAVILEEVLKIVLQQDIDARQLEMTAYVLFHADELNDEQRRKLTDSVNVKTGSDELPGEAVNAGDAKGTVNAKRKRKQSVKEYIEDSATKPESRDDEKETPARQSKRRKEEIVT